ncbi:type ISP restriction/modification enzyme [Brevundimonas sp.]|uniref:DEAD/DEAH box helicase n=1 Tax=Brevundimonas sp. TaxID=1871086 RepID=UPI00261384E5|nr:type ISP restriction/modification enzyme [Brevundimonas sp.]
MSDFRTLLKSFRDAAKTEREKGSYFERIAVDFIRNDPGMAQEYEDAWLFSDWAKANGVDGRDTGIDAVAKLRDEGGYCAIQCKFYREGHRIAKADIDSFFTASGKHPFVRRLIIDTTDVPWSGHAEEALDGQQITTTRIGLDRLSDSPINWAAYLHEEKIEVAPKKQLRPHQQDALDCVRDGLAEADRGKLIMACGTGKTFTGLKIAEAMVGVGKSVLFLVPSLSLMSQTIREWTIDSETPLASFAVCSDAQVGKRQKNKDDVAEVEAHDLDYPATTNAGKLAAKVAKASPDRMTAVFATYQSLPVVAAAQSQHGMVEFDLIICDEAHRTTGASFPGQEDSNFIKVHDQAFIQGKKRVYMTATPRVFGDSVKGKAADASVELCSMDDESLFGKTLFARGFGWAVENQLLTDYKVIVLAVDEAMVSSSMQRRLADGTSELKLDDATKIIGCYKALTKNGLSEDVAADPQPMERALAFCKDIASSKLIKDEFAAVIGEYLASEEGQETEAGRPRLGCELRHVDGTFNAKERTRALEWLKEDTNGEVCRILTNARCLSEGVDVPALDAILFMHPRKSQIDVVQSVGRVMRRAEGKRMGYIILPIGVPAGMTPEEALRDNERYRVVWDILNALRSHDERFDSTINKMGLGVDVSDQIEVVAVTNKLPTKTTAAKGKANIGQGSAADDDEIDGGSLQPGMTDTQGEFVFDEFAKAIMAKIVKKCGKRDYWEDWATDIAKIAQTHITRITATVAKEGSKERAAFEAFLAEIRDDLNDSITEAEAIEMLAQHIITKPVFEALFEDHSFARNNPVSIAMQSVLDVLQEQNLEKEAEALQNFYDSVRRRAAGIDSAEAKQRIIVELYDKFFRKAFPRMTEKLGIVYTPVEIVDFIIRSVDEVLRSEFDQNLGSEGVHIIDPFTGTGTFITRLLQSGLISPEDLRRKYLQEIHANEIVLLAYYIAAINIEAVYSAVSEGEYEPFQGICLTDTFQLWEKDDLEARMMADNSTRRTRQKGLPIRVIIGNPPYSAGQKSENDNAANVAYLGLDQRIRETYAAKSSATNKNGLYDSYIRAFRWGSDRLAETGGILAFVTNGAWIDGNTMDGLRKSFSEEFSSINLFHLRGNARTQGEQRQKEKGNVFGSGSRAPIAITILVKNPGQEGPCKIRFHDIGDYLTTSDKLARVRDFGSVGGIERVEGWRAVVPNEQGDWINKRDSSFESFLALGSKDRSEPDAVFELYSNGVKTQRDAWCFNSSKASLNESIQTTIRTYEIERERFASLKRSFLSARQREDFLDAFVVQDPRRISWSRALKADLGRGKKISFDPHAAREAIYRPFQKQWLYLSRELNEMVYRVPFMFPDAQAANRIIGVTGTGGRGDFTALMTDVIPSLHMADRDGAQYFPRYVYENGHRGDGGLFEANQAELTARDAISNLGLDSFKMAYPTEVITKDDLFHYVYGMLHSPDYRRRFSDNLRKELPRIPLVKSAGEFWAFRDAGRMLGDLHCDYETVEPYPVTFKEGDLRFADIPNPRAFFRVEQMRFAGKRGGVDRSTVIYNPNITMIGIPLEAYDYVVNGQSALEWVMERQVVKTDKDSGIVNDANRYAVETVGDPAYPLKLFQRVITVSLETMKIVRSLPPLDIMPEKGNAETSTTH